MNSSSLVPHRPPLSPGHGGTLSSLPELPSTCLLVGKAIIKDACSELTVCILHILNLICIYFPLFFVHSCLLTWCWGWSRLPEPAVPPRFGSSCKTLSRVGGSHMCWGGAGGNEILPTLFKPLFLSQIWRDIKLASWKSCPTKVVSCPGRKSFGRSSVGLLLWNKDTCTNTCGIIFREN